MQNIPINSYGFALQINGLPETNEEYFVESGRAPVEDALKHYKLIHMATFRNRLPATLASATGLEVGQGESIGSYIVRLTDHLSANGRSLADYQSAAQELLDSIPVNLKSAARRPARGLKPAKKYLAKATTLLAEGKLAGFLESEGIPVNDVLNHDGSFNEHGARIAANAIRKRHVAWLSGT
jgi:hypothetical protein